ncbi:MAG TPA: SdpI family protein [Methylocystis sp.]|nr:SdpI family protein [Methylocystis sp.]
MRTDRAVMLSVALVVTAFAVSLIFYDSFPERVPMHWNADGVADRTVAKPWGPFVSPLVMAGMLALFLVLPRISPRGYEIEPFRRSYDILQLGLIAFIFLVNLVVLLNALGFPIPMSRLLPVGLGLLFALIGNFLGKVTVNFFVGIRTPWTLADPEVWLRTHRFAGRLFVAVGLGMAVCGLLGVASHWLLAAALLLCVAPAAYSYVVYSRLNDHRPPA